jgi:hypothetical protein
VWRLAADDLALDALKVAAELRDDLFEQADDALLGHVHLGGDSLRRQRGGTNRIMRFSSHRSATIMQTGSPVPPRRDDVLSMLYAAMTDISTRIAAADPQTPAEERLHLKRGDTLAHLAGQYRMLKRDTDIDEMHDRLELLETGTG